MDDFLIYTGLNITLTPMMDDEDKKKGEIYVLGIPIYYLNSLLYTYVGKFEIIPYQELIFKTAFQTFFDSLLYDSFSPVIIDALIAISSITIKNNINK